MVNPQASQPPQRPCDLAGGSLSAIVWFAVVAAVVLTADLVSKRLAFEYVATVPVVVSGCGQGDTFVPRHIPITVIPNVLSLKLTTNQGAVFGVGQGRQWLFVVVSVVAVGFVVGVFWRSPARQRVLHVALALILAGALGNLHDRLRYCAVRDMLYLFPDVNLPFGLSWPGSGLRGLYPWIFNVADVALVVGVGLVLILSWRGRPPEPEDEKDPR